LTTVIKGDLIVFDWAPYGHVAVIDTVTSTGADVVEQNGDPSGRNSYTLSSAYCFLTAGKPPSGPSCGSLPNGWFCGNDGVFGSTNTNYFCDDGKITQTTNCDFACVIVPGSNDQCSNTGSCSGLPDGWFCGNDKIGGESDVLYFCNGGKADGAKYCANGCQINPGVNDSCKE